MPETHGLPARLDRRIAPWLLALFLGGAACASSTPAPATSPAADRAQSEAQSEAHAARPAPRAATPQNPEPSEPSPPSPPRQGPGWLGVELAKLEDGRAGVLIKDVMRDSPAERAGLVGGDIVVSIDGASVASPHELRQRVIGARSGTRVSLGVLRGDQTRLFGVDLEAMPTDDEVMRKKYVGAPAPDFGALTTVQGSVNPSLPALRGRVVVLEFWATWCGVCHLMAPTLSGWHDRYAAQGLTVLGVTSDPVDLASHTASEQRMGYPLASDGSGEIQRTYRAYALPTLFVIDKRGTVRDVLVGYSTPRLREIEQLVRKLIAEG